MRVILFQDRFAELVRAGTKRQTIRQSARCQPGDTLSLRRWTGKPYRSRQETLCQVDCAEVVPIQIEIDVPELTMVKVGEAWLTGEQRNALAIEDGFLNWAAMHEWFHRHHGLPFYGVVIRWVGVQATGTTNPPAAMPGHGQ
jgi:uncharacterized protein YqfB (UPF0267 family)